MSKTKASIPLLSFFCGAGGLDLGFREAGFSTLLAVDADATAVATFNANAPGSVGIKADINTIDLSHIKEEIASRHSSMAPRGVIGGPPCQGFSNGNVVNDPRDPRNRLPFAYARLLAALNAHYELDFFVFENVTGLLRERHRSRLSRIKTAFRKAGFNVFQHQVDAIDFGVAQHRKRLFLVGINNKKWPEVCFSFPTGSEIRRTVRDVIGGLPAPTLFRHGLAPSDVSFHPNHWTMQPRSQRFATGKFNKWRSFRQLDWNSPSPTVAYGNREIHIHPNGTRRLSVFEAMLLQGFPRDYEFTGNLSQQVTQVSNAVPPPVARELALALRRTLGFTAKGTSA